MIDHDIDLSECPVPEPFRNSLAPILILTSLFYVTFVSRILFAPLMPFIQNDLGIGSSRAGTLFLSISGGLFFAPLLVGWLSAGIKYRGTLAVSNIGVGLALLVISFSKSLMAMQLMMILLGMLAGFHIPSAVAGITAQVQKPDWGKALGIHQIAPPMSFVTTPLIATALVLFMPWRGVLTTWGVISICLGIGYWLWGKSGDFRGQGLSLAVAKEVLSQRAFWIIIILLGMAMSATAGIYAMLPLYLVREKGFDPGLANTLIGLSQISGLIMVFFAGMIADRIGPKRTIAMALFGTGIATILIGVLDGAALAVIIFLQPLFVTSFFPAAFASLSRSVRPRLRGVSNALGPSFGFLVGGGITPTVIGYLAEVRSFSTGIILVGCYVLLGIVVAQFLKLGQYDEEEGC